MLQCHETLIWGSYRMENEEAQIAYITEVLAAWWCEGVITYYGALVFLGGIGGGLDTLGAIIMFLLRLVIGP